MNKKFLLTLARVLLILLIAAVAAALRLRAVALLPVDYDEDDYLRAGQLYAQDLRRGDWSVLTRENYRTEHPPLSKIVYGITLLNLPDFPLIPDRPTTAGPDTTLPKAPLHAARNASALFGVLEAALLALINPLAGLFVATNTFNIKYTSQVMLEGVPSFTSLLVVTAYLLWRRKPRHIWLVLSALALGLTTAAKYYYAIAGIAVAAHWLVSAYRAQEAPWRRPRWLAPLLTWGCIAVVTFFLVNPYLWPDPIHRLAQSIAYHGGYAQSAAVTSAHFPFWQPLVWLSMSVPWHPGVFLLPLDMIVTLLALFGLRRARERHPVFLLWLALALGFLLIWPTKWPQYTLLITAPVAVVAADGFQAAIAEPLAAWWKRLRAHAARQQRQARGHAALSHFWQVFPWLLPGLLALTLITLFPLIYQLAMAMTDFRGSAIKDGINGGVWREVWMGLTGQVAAREVDIFNLGGGRQVHYTGLNGLINVLFGAGELYVFELVWTVLAVATQAALGVAIALMLHRPGVRFKSFWQTLFILPWAVPEFVAALSWSQVVEPRFGFLSLAAKSWSQTAPGSLPAAGWQENPNLALIVLLVAGLWYGFPFMMLSARAGLKLIPEDIYEAAALDGASGWQLFLQVTWPLVFPLLLPAIILRAIFAFNQFYLFTVLNTPVITLSALSYYIFSDGAYATSAIINVVTVIILIGLVLWFNRLTKATEGVSYA